LVASDIDLTGLTGKSCTETNSVRQIPFTSCRDLSADSSRSWPSN
jgi:hypothetical protein